VTPLCAAFVVALTYLLGVRLSGRATGLMSASIVAASPTFIFMSLSSMSDVPATAFWTAAIVAACRPPSALAAGLAGTAAGIAITIRPNLAPLAVFPALLAVVGRHPHRVRRAASFAAACLPFVLFVAAVNQSLYGSAVRSGYGDLESLFKPANAAPNVSRFARWLWQTQGPLVFVCVLAPIVRWRRGRLDEQTRAETSICLVLLAFIGGVFACYLLYTPFEAWWFLRFVLPAFPAMFVLAADAVWIGSRRFPPRLRVAVPLVFTLVCVDWGVRLCRANNVLELGDVEQKYADVGRFIARELPPNAAVIALLHSGSVRYYSGRTTLRFEWLDPQGLDRAVTYLKSNGLDTYAVLETSELAGFREKFTGQKAVAALERPPLASHTRGVYLYAIDPTHAVETPRAIPRTSGCE
jgi:4-amino-4-deoxy-L-arabinose transferase-like glycosyltransferase